MTRFRSRILTLSRATVISASAAIAVFIIETPTTQASTMLPQPESNDRNAQVEAWMSTNGGGGERIEPALFEAPSWGAVRSIREGSTSTAFLFIFDRPANGVLFMPDMGGDITSVNLISGEEADLAWRSVDDGLLVGLPPQKPLGSFGVVAVSCKGDPVRYEVPHMVGVESAFLESATLELVTRSALDIRYTTDGSDPRPQSPRYSEPIRLGRTTEVRARSYYQGRPVSRVISQRFEQLPDAWKARAVGAQPGLIEEEYGGTWSTMPQFDGLKPRALRTKTQFGFPTGTTPGSTGLRQRGVVNVPENGAYQFELVSDDGGRLWIDGHLVVDLDGLHAATAKTGMAPLMAGGHDIVVEYFNATGGSALSVRMGVGKGPLALIPESSLTHDTTGDDQ
jgi:hypothetical protein